MVCRCLRASFRDPGETVAVTGERLVVVVARRELERSEVMLDGVARGRAAETDPRELVGEQQVAREEQRIRDIHDGNVPCRVARRMQHAQFAAGDVEDVAVLEQAVGSERRPRAASMNSVEQLRMAVGGYAPVGELRERNGIRDGRRQLPDAVLLQTVQRDRRP